MTQTEGRDTTRDPLSSNPTELLGRRVIVRYRPDGAASDAEVYGAVVAFDPNRRHGGEFMVRLEGTGEVARYGTWRIRLATPDPTPCAGDAVAEHAAAEWVARSRGQLAVLGGPYHSTYHALVEAGRDICRAIDAARMPKPCQFTWARVDKTSLGLDIIEDAPLFGCAFTTEPGSRFCGVHLPLIEQHGHPVIMLPRDRATIVTPIDSHDPLRYVP
jgi:hypothetical protein